VSVWLLFATIGVGTFLLRYSLIALWGRFGSVPRGVERALRFIPPAVLSALVLPSVATSDGALVVGPRVAAGLIAAAVAWKTKSVLGTIVAGMGVLWILQAL
jgi:branched-subunit amino acid transport protein